jgi:hypothetical protein
MYTESFVKKTDVLLIAEVKSDIHTEMLLGCKPRPMLDPGRPYLT